MVACTGGGAGRPSARGGGGCRNTGTCCWGRSSRLRFAPLLGPAPRLRPVPLHNADGLGNASHDGESPTDRQQDGALHWHECRLVLEGRGGPIPVEEGDGVDERRL